MADWQTFIVLTTLSIAIQVVSTAAPGSHLRVPQMIFIFAGVLLLPPIPLLLLILIPNFLEWEHNRREGTHNARDGYKLLLRIAYHTTAAFSALGLLDLLQVELIWSARIQTVLAIIAAAALYALLHHSLSQGPDLLQGLDWRDSELIDLDIYFSKLAYLFVGYGVAVLWKTNPWLILLSMIPGLIYYQLYVIPRLKKEAYTDAKTGLSNMRHFDELFEVELSRASRLQKSLAVIMIDVDDLGVINNTYGHLAGDAALMTVSSQILHHIRPNDIAARLGGEEFCIVVTDVNEKEAMEFAETLRTQIAQASFHTTSMSQPQKTTVSIGVAIYPWEGATNLELIHSADIAMYHAKMNGKNQVVSASLLPQNVNGTQSRESTEVVNYRAAFGSSSSGKQGQEKPLNQQRSPDTIPPASGSWTNRGTLHPSGSIDISAMTYTGKNGAASVEGVLSEPSDWVPTTTLQAPPDQVRFVRDSAVVKYQSQVAVKPPQKQNDLPKVDTPNGTDSLVRQGHTPRVFVYSVLALGILSVVFGLLFIQNSYALSTLGLFGMVAIFVQLLQLSMHDTISISVSAAVILAGTILLGTPGLLATSGCVVLVHAFQFQPKPYKIAFNWAVHLLAGLAPLSVYALNISYTPIGFQVQVVLVLVAAMAYFLIESFLIAMAISFSTQQSALYAWKKHFRWQAPHYLVSGFVGLSMALAYKALGIWGVLSFVTPVLFMYFAQKRYVKRANMDTKELSQMNHKLGAANNEISAAYGAIQQQNDELFLILSKIIDARDPDVHGHAAQVAHYAAAIANELGVAPEEVDLIRKGAMLHDIGKLGIAEAILHKPGPLTDEEYEIMKEHPTIGANFLETCQILRNVTPYVRHHHERWDGLGYPDGLVDTHIPLGARIVSVCDAVEAMASDRPYRKGLSASEIVQELKRGMGKQFDPTVIQAFTKILAREGKGFLINTATQFRQ